MAVTQYCIACGRPVSRGDGKLLVDCVVPKNGGFVCSNVCWVLSDYIQCGYLVGRAWNELQERDRDFPAGKREDRVRLRLVD